MGVLTDDQVAQLAGERTPVECTVAKGAIIAMRPLTVHASSKSTSETPRKVLHIEYAVCSEINDGLQLAQG